MRGNSDHTQRTNVRSRFEQLENRQLLSVNLGGDGVLSIIGSARRDNLAVSVSGQDLVVDFNGQQQTFALDQVSKLFIDGKAGADVLQLAADVNIPATIIGGAGADRITGGAADDDLLGGKGADRIDGQGGADHIEGGAGNDKIYGGDGADSIWGGTGNDWVNSGKGKDKVHGGAGDDEVDRGGAAPVIQRTAATPRAVNNTVVGYTPQQIWRAYGIDKLKSLYPALYTTAKMGQGQTVAIVSAFDMPTMQADLDAFSTQFNLPKVTITKVAASGSTPNVDAGWTLETAQAVERVHAIAPAANIILVEADTDAQDDLMAAVDVAVTEVKNAGGGVISLSWGFDPEFANEVNLDSHLNNANTKTISFVAAAVDSAGVTGWPDSSPYVLSVGATTLSLTAGGNRVAAESAWTDTGGGLSTIYNRPTFQNTVTINGTTPVRRSVPDIAFSGDPDFGVAVFSSTPVGGDTGWFKIGGTSSAAPQIAGLVALANQMRGSKGLGEVGNKLQTEVYKAAIYNYPANFLDITSGPRALVGFDTSTGLGTPKAAGFVATLGGVVKLAGGGKFTWDGRVTDSIWSVPSSDRSRITWVAGGGSVSRVSGKRWLTAYIDQSVKQWDPNLVPKGAGVSTADITVTSPLKYQYKGKYSCFGTADIVMSDGDEMLMDLKFVGKLKTVNNKDYFFGEVFTTNEKGKRVSQGLYPILEGNIVSNPPKPIT